MNIRWLTTSIGSFTYWIIAKVIIWILPALWLIRLSGKNIWMVLYFSNWRSYLIWGGGIVFFIALISFIPNYLYGNPLLPKQFSIPLLNVLIIAPVFEELMVRGAILGNLRLRYSLFTANIISSLMFIVLHVPGWYFSGSLVEKFTSSVEGALSIFFLGLAFGYATFRSRSVIGGMLAHFLNSLS